MEEPGERELKIWLGRKGMGYKWHSLPLRQKGRKDTHIYIYWWGRSQEVKEDHV